MQGNRRITLCADDFAIDADASSAILDLAAGGRISAASCMTDAPLWSDMGTELLRHQESVLIGLHFNLTQPVGGARASLFKTMCAAASRLIDPGIVRYALERQVDKFAAVAGRLPDFIDGHMHVHAFPVISAVVRRTAQELSPAAPIPVRSVRNFFGPTDAPLKRAVIRLFAAMGSQRGKAVRELNHGFAGDYSLRASADYAGLLRSWLELAPDRALIMCHPRRHRAGEPASAGGMEFRFLDSPDFAGLLAQCAIRFLRRDDLAGETLGRRE